MNKLLALPFAVSLLLAGAAFAGEVKGPPGNPDDPEHNTNTTAAPEHAKSACAFSGLNDFDEEGQNDSIVQTAADSWKFYGYPKGFVGVACKGAPAGGSGD